MRAPLHLLVLDEDDTRREADMKAVDRIGHHAIAAARVDEVTARRGRLSPDLMLFSEETWRAGGRELVRDFEGRGKSCRVLVVGDERSLGRSPELMDQGVQGVLLFPLSTAELDRAIEGIMMGPTADVRFTGEFPAAEHPDAPEEISQVPPEPERTPEEVSARRSRVAVQVKELASELRAGRARVSDISPVAMELQALCATDEPPSMALLVGKIEQDPNLTASVLKASNAAAYQGMPPVLDLAAAGRRLGSRRMGEVAQTEAIKGAFSARQKTGWSRLLSKMWRTTVCTAHTARLMVEQIGAASRGEVYSMALFHNLGEVLVVDLYRKAGETAPRDGFVHGQLLEDMNRLHTDLGALLLRSWGMPMSLASIAVAHHDPSKLPSGTPLARSAWLIGGAYAAVIAAGCDYKKPHDQGPPLAAASAVLGVSGDAFREAAEQSVEWWSSGRE